MKNKNVDIIQPPLDEESLIPHEEAEIGQFKIGPTLVGPVYRNKFFIF